MFSITPQASGVRQPRKWTIAEDQKLRQEVEAQMAEGEVKDWCRIASTLPGRTNKDCRKRWHNSVAGGLKKGQWAKNEDVLLQRGVHKYGQRWTLVAEVVGSRSADQCAKRWQQSLDPDLDRSEWRDNEDKVLIQAVTRLGRHWKDIQQQHFPGRSKNCIKNRYTVLLRRMQNQPTSLYTIGNSSQKRTSVRSPRSINIEDDIHSNNSVMYEPDRNYPPTAVSTPVSWIDDNEPFSAWSPCDPYISSPSNTALHQPSYIDPASPNYQWPTSTLPLATTSMETPSIMNTNSAVSFPDKTNNTFFNLTPSAVGSIVSPLDSDSYAASATMLASTLAPTSAPILARPRSSQYPSPPTSSRGSTRSLNAYEDSEAMARYMGVPMQRHNHYR